MRVGNVAKRCATSAARKRLSSQHDNLLRSLGEQFAAFVQPSLSEHCAAVFSRKLSWQWRIATCKCVSGPVRYGLTVHSSRCRFAARLNSSVRPYKSSFECGRETQPKDALLLQRASVCHRNMEISCARWASSLPQSCNFPSRSIVLCVFLAHCIGSDASQLASVFLARYGMA